MTLSCVFPIASMAASFAGRSLVLALAVSPQVNAADQAAPTAKEQALMEHACRTTQKPGAPRDAYEECTAARLQSLRADFGTDLGKLSTSARGKIDAACSQAQASLGREAYLECLSVQLASLSGRARATRAAAASPALPPQGAIMPSAALIVPAPAPQESSLLALVSVKSAGIVLASLGVVIGLVVFAMKPKRVKHLCRVCGGLLPGTGDLCATCRHEAAETLRRAAGERVERQRAEEAEQRQRELADEQRQQELLRQEEEDRVRRLDEQRQQEDGERLREEDARQLEAEARRLYDVQPPTASAASSEEPGDSTFDPYLGLGLTPDASHDEIRAAYEAARTKYDPDLVEHLGTDVKDHFAEKFRTAERAYRMIAGTIDETTNAPAR